MRFSVLLPVALLAGSQISLALPTPAAPDSVGIAQRSDDGIPQGTIARLNARESDGHGDATNRLEERTFSESVRDRYDRVKTRITGNPPKTQRTGSTVPLIPESGQGQDRQDSVPRQDSVQGQGLNSPPPLVPDNTGQKENEKEGVVHEGTKLRTTGEPNQAGTEIAPWA